jgi:hypothetical protein
MVKIDLFGERKKIICEKQKKSPFDKQNSVVGRDP